MKKYLIVIFLMVGLMATAQNGEVFSVLKLEPQATAPTNAFWTNGSLYRHTDGTIYHKVGGSWVALGAPTSFSTITGLARDNTDLNAELDLKAGLAEINTFTNQNFFSNGLYVWGDGTTNVLHNSLIFKPFSGAYGMSGSSAALTAYNRNFLWQTGIANRGYIFNADAITAVRTYDLPNKSGTIALIDDLDLKADDNAVVHLAGETITSTFALGYNNGGGISVFPSTERTEISGGNGSGTTTKSLLRLGPDSMTFNLHSTGTGVLDYIFNGNYSLDNDVARKKDVDAAVLGAGTDDQTAAEVPFTPNGSIAATNVQAAIQEVRDEAVGGLASTDIDTSAELKAIVTDETGSGALVFATSPILTTPDLGTPSALVLTNATGLVSAGIVDGTIDELDLDVSINASLDKVALMTLSAPWDMDSAITTLAGAEQDSNKTTDLTSPDDTKYPTSLAVSTALADANLLGIETATTSRTAVLTDADGVLQITNASPMTYTIPLNATVAYEIGTVISIKQMGAGAVTLAYTGGVTGEAGGTYAKNDRIVIMKTATDTWVVLQHPTFRQMTQAAYDGITPIDGILYVIVG